MKILIKIVSSLFLVVLLSLFISILIKSTISEMNLFYFTLTSLLSVITVVGFSLLTILDKWEINKVLEFKTKLIKVIASKHE